MAEQLELSIGAYGNIERGVTDVTISRLHEIAFVLETDLSTILNFDAKNVFNQCHNRTANGNVQNLQIMGEQDLKEVFLEMKKDIEVLKKKVK